MVNTEILKIESHRDWIIIRQQKCLISMQTGMEVAKNYSTQVKQ